MPFWEPQQTLTVLQWLARAGTAYLILFVMARLMGQREVGQLTIFDFIVAISIGSVTASPLSSAPTSLTGAMISIITLAGFQILVAVVSLKFSKFRRVFQGEPIVVVQNGQLLEDTMRKARYNLDDLLMGLRQHKITSLMDVEFAILEPNGKLSVIPKSQARPVTPSDLGLTTKYEGLSTVLVEDGNVLEDNLRENKLSKEWLLDQLAKQGITNPNEVLAVTLDTKGRLYVSKQDQTNEEWIH